MRYDCLIVDDETMLADNTAEYFNLFGVNTKAVYGSAECLAFWEENTAEVMLLDITLADGSGFRLCKTLREKTQVPILFISARSSDDDQIVAFNIGGDDYIEKPYSLGVLLAKVKAVLKRSAGIPAAEVWTDGRLKIDFTTHSVTVNDVPIRLTAMEYKLLAYLASHPNKVVTKQELFDNVWEDKFTGDGTLNVHVRKLRESIEPRADKPQYIVTIWGDGYSFRGNRA